MKAAYFDKTGGPEVIQYGELPKPAPQPGEVLIKVLAAGLNPIDTYIRSGLVQMPLPKPFVPGCDLAGIVEAVGPSVTRFKAGDRVWGTNQGLLGRQGTFAEYAAVHEDWLYLTPAETSDETAAGGALTSITAHLGLFRCAQLQPGETVFVNGGTGGVGSMVVQQAKAVAAKVITTVGSTGKAAKCKMWNADLVLNYKTDPIDDKIKEFTGGQGVNVWYETQREPDFLRTFPLLAKRGRMIVMAGRQAQPVFPLGQFYPRDLALFGFAMFNASPDEQRVSADDINFWYTEKKLQVPVGKRFKFAEAAAAHKFLEDNTLHKAGTLAGKIVLAP